MVFAIKIETSIGSITPILLPKTRIVRMQLYSHFCEDVFVYVPEKLVGTANCIGLPRIENVEEYVINDVMAESTIAFAFV